MLSTLSTVEIAWVTALTTTGAAVAGYAFGRLDRRRKRGRARESQEKEAGEWDEVVFEDPVVGTRKRKLRVITDSLVATSVHKRTRTGVHPTSLQTPEVTPARRNQAEGSDRELNYISPVDSDVGIGQHIRVVSPPPATPSYRRHVHLGLLTPAGSSDREAHSTNDGDQALRERQPDFDEDNDVESEAVAQCDSDATIARVHSVSKLLHSILPSPSATPSQRPLPLRNHERFAPRPRPRGRRRKLSSRGSKRVVDGYESGISAPPSEESDSDCSYHEGSDASSYDSRASSPGLNVPSDDEFWDGSDAESEGDEGVLA